MHLVSPEWNSGGIKWPAEMLEWVCVMTIRMQLHASVESCMEGMSVAEPAQPTLRAADAATNLCAIIVQAHSRDL